VCVSLSVDVYFSECVCLSLYVYVSKHEGIIQRNKTGIF